MLPCDAGCAEVVHPGPATAPNPARRLRFIWQRYFDGGYSSESYTRYNPGGGYESLQRSGNARMGSYHYESHGARSPNAAWTNNVTDASWGPR